MRSPNVSRKLLLLLAGAGVCGLLLQACTTTGVGITWTSPVMLDWTQKAVPIRKGRNTPEKEAILRHALKTWPEEGHYEVSFHFKAWPGPDRCLKLNPHTINQNIACDGKTIALTTASEGDAKDGPTIDAMHVTQLIGFVNTDQKKLFLDALGVTE